MFNKTLAMNSWDTIALACTLGIADKVGWKTQDTKNVTVHIIASYDGDESAISVVKISSISATKIILNSTDTTTVHIQTIPYCYLIDTIPATSISCSMRSEYSSYQDSYTTYTLVVNIVMGS